MAKKRAKLGIFEELGVMLRAQPFRPFDIKTADGDTIHVRHPDFVARSPSGDTAIAYDVNDHHRVINMHQVVTIEPTKLKTGFGKPGRK